MKTVTEEDLNVLQSSWKRRQEFYLRYQELHREGDRYWNEKNDPSLSKIEQIQLSKRGNLFHSDGDRVLELGNLIFIDALIKTYGKDVSFAEVSENQWIVEGIFYK